MALTLTISDDRKKWDALMGELSGLDGSAVFAGIVDPELATRAARHELGEGPPKRLFAAPAADQAAGRAMSKARRELGAVLDGQQDRDDALQEVGEVFEDAVRDYVELGRVGGKPLKEAAQRNDSRALIDTGDMIDALETIVAPSIDGEDS
jgi:hypothetical protein